MKEAQILAAIWYIQTSDTPFTKGEKVRVEAYTGTMAWARRASDSPLDHNRFVHWIDWQNLSREKP